MTRMGRVAVVDTMCRDFTGHFGEILRICGCEIDPGRRLPRMGYQPASEFSGRRRVTAPRGSGSLNLTPCSGDLHRLFLRDGPAADRADAIPCMEQATPLAIN